MLGVAMLYGAVQHAYAGDQKSQLQAAYPAGVVKPAFFDKQGITVTGYQKGASGLNVWQVEKGSTKTVFYTTADNKTLISGIFWDAESGANLSDAYIPDSAKLSPDAAVVPQERVELQAANSGPSKISAAISGISKLTGITEGKAAPDKTLYIIFDPRCPYCHGAYTKTREYVKKGGTIKWIPTTVLGQSGDGATLVADILQSKDPVAAMAKTIGKKGRGAAFPNVETMKALRENEEYFFAAFDANPSLGQPGVPVAFFETQAGKPQMVVNVDDPVLLSNILKDIKK
jgi:hypothetical protein